MNEEEIFDFQDQHGLITLGWIHVGYIYLLFRLYVIMYKQLFLNELVYKPVLTQICIDKKLWLVSKACRCSKINLS